MASSETMEGPEEESPLLPSKLSRLSAIGLGGNDEDIQRVGAFLRKGSLVGLGMWLALLLFLHGFLAPADSYEYLEGVERNANILVVLLLIATNGSRLLPLLFRGRARVKTGAIIGFCTVQLIAISSVTMMVILPTPVLVDPITGQRVSLVRWCQWITLAFLMTFLTEGIDMPNQGPKAESLAWKHGAAIALSTAAGLIFPFCQTLTIWIVNFVISCILFLSLYIRLYQRYRRVQTTSKGRSVEEQERYERVRYSYRLLQACSVVWTLLVVAFTVCCFGQTAPAGTWLSYPALPVLVECVFEVSSKIWYLNLLVDANEQIFDESSRAIRRLEEMRYLMSVVWESSSDVIVLCAKGSDRIKAVVSPTFLRMSKTNDKNEPNKTAGGGEEAIALVFEVMLGKERAHKIFAMNMSHPVTEANSSDDNDLLRRYVSSDPASTDQRNITSIATLIAKTWDLHDNKGDSLLMHELHGYGSDGEEEVFKWEAKVTRLETDAIVLVLRDISERFQRFEAEKRLVAEVTERKKDFEANRFTRHEVKNGLLSAIGLVQSVKESWERRTTGSSAQDEMPHQDSDSSLGAMETRSSEANLNLTELELTLLEVLDTVMSEAMARDVVHEVYEPQKGRIDARSVLQGLRGGTDARFPLVTNPADFPDIFMDAQLLRYIHRNAISNACKYGKDGGIVTTLLSYDKKKKELQLEIINLPGPRNDELCNLSDEARDKVFNPGTMLHSASDSTLQSLGESLVSSSSGDGAWIMQKCAETLGGKCSIRFDEDRTVFTMSCPAQACLPQTDLGKARMKKEFSLPATVWGIAIDDSVVQRKLLDRFMSHLGVKSARRQVLGKDSNEVLGFTDYVRKQVHDHPDDKFLLIVDENLEIQEGVAREKTISGSLCVKHLREMMDPADEQRILALVRSANDNAEDVALYRSRAHGYLPKAPIQKNRVLEQMQPLWEDRFPQGRHKSASTAVSSTSSESADDGFLVSSDDLMHSLEVIDELCMTSDETELSEKWPTIREKLHALKGDLKTMNANARTGTVLESLDKLKGESVPNEFAERWKLIRSLIVSLL